MVKLKKKKKKKKKKKNEKTLIIGTDRPEQTV